MTTPIEEKASKLDSLYRKGKTAIFASRVDPRFPYALFVPYRYECMAREETTLLVSVHGTGRMQSLYRDLFVEFAEYHNCIVIAPLFPANVLGDENLSGYKYLEERDIRYDRVVLGMIEEVAERYRVSGEKVLMFGFSGGAHFTHRFTILHPRRIRAASIGSPGSVTLLDPSRPWWVGTADVEQRFGIRIDYSLFTGLPLHFVVGGADTETWEITLQEGDTYWQPGANDSGRTRVERIGSLADSFAAQGARVRVDVLAGKTHEVTSLARRSRDFFHDVLTGVFPD